MAVNYITVMCMECGRESSDSRRLYKCMQCDGEVEFVFQSAPAPEPEVFSYDENQQLKALVDAQLAQLLHYCKALQDAGNQVALEPQQHQVAILMQIGNKLSRDGERLAMIEKDYMAREQARIHALRLYEGKKSLVAA